MLEIFKDVNGYEGLYQVSNMGRVKSLERKVSNGKGYRVVEERILNHGIDGCGYYTVRLYKSGDARTKKLHQLVAMSFLNHNPCGLDRVVDHINDDKLDNRVENLQLITTRENLSKDKKGSSKYTGVCWDKSQNKWMSQIRVGYKRIYLGRFEDEYISHLTYQKALINIDKYNGCDKSFRELCQVIGV